MSFLTRRALVPLILLPVANAQTRYQAVRDPESPADIPYTRYFTTDRFDRRITFYVEGKLDERLPLVGCILGSGAFSNFIRGGDRTLDAHRTAREAFAGRAHVLIVEKPGVEFLEQHPDRGTAKQASTEYREQHTLERWSEAVSAALRAARSLPLSDSSRCLLIGHSEGGIIMGRVAAENAFVTHVAALAGGGPTQLFDLIESARAGRLYSDLPSDPDAQAAKLLADIAEIRSDPDNADKLFLGHPYRRWSTFWNSSTADELLKTRARIFIAQGTADRNVSVTSFDVLYATLLAGGRQVTARRITGADHGFGFADQPRRDGWKEVFEEVRDWFVLP
jgi:predicted esterase